jgi:serine/alanine adding enzyme
MKVLLNNEIPRKQWRDFADQNPLATPFQTPEYFDFYSNLQNLSAKVIAIEDKGELLSLCVISFQKEDGIKGWFSNRAIIYGGPIIKKDSDEAVSLLLQVIKKQIKGNAIYVETRNLNDYLEFKINFIKAGWQYKPYINYIVTCVDKDIIWSNLNRSRKRQIKKAQSNDVVIVEDATLQDVEDLYNILYEVYKKKIGKPLFNWDFFRVMYKSDFCKVIIVKADKKVIGGHFCLLYKDVIYDWYGCGLDIEYKEFAPSTMVVYAGLLYGAKHNFKYFDFMGAGSPTESYGVRGFKAQFGGEQVEYGRFRLILKPVLFRIGEAGIRLLSRMKS